MSEYSTLKAGWHTGRIAQLRRTGAMVPAQIQLIISDLCNHDCSFCAYRMSGYTSNEMFGEMTPQGLNNNPNRKIDTDKCLEILQDAAQMGVQGVQFTGGGEPTVHPEHLTIFKYAMDAGLEAALVTNGCILREGWEGVLPRMAWIRVSVDAGREHTYCSIRKVRPFMWSRLLTNLEALAVACRDSETTLGASFIITKDNIREIGAAADLVRGLGVPSIRYAAVFTPIDDSYYTAEMMDVARGQLSYAKSRQTRGFRVIDMFGSRLGDLEQHAPDYRFCGYQHFNVYIGGDLNVYRCCNTAYSQRGMVGSLKSQRFKDFWLSEAKHAAYTKFDARGCERCAFNGQNRTIGYLVDKKPKHVAFV